MSEQNALTNVNAGEAAASNESSKIVQPKNLDFVPKPSSDGVNSDVNPNSSEGSSRSNERIQGLIAEKKEMATKFEAEKKELLGKTTESQEAFNKLKAIADPLHKFHQDHAKDVEVYKTIVGSDPSKLDQIMSILQGTAPAGQDYQNVNDDELSPEERLNRQMADQTTEFNKQLTGIQTKLDSSESRQNTLQYKQDMGEVLKNLMEKNPTIDENRASKFIDTMLRAQRGDYKNINDIYRLGKEFVKVEAETEARYKAKWEAEQKLKDETKDLVPLVHGSTSLGSADLPKDIDMNKFVSDGEGFRGNFKERAKAASAGIGTSPY